MTIVGRGLAPAERIPLYQLCLRSISQADYASLIKAIIYISYGGSKPPPYNEGRFVIHYFIRKKD